MIDGPRRCWQIGEVAALQDNALHARPADGRGEVPERPADRQRDGQSDRRGAGVLLVSAVRTLASAIESDLDAPVVESPSVTSAVHARLIRQTATQLRACSGGPRLEQSQETPKRTGFSDERGAESGALVLCSGFQPQRTEGADPRLGMLIEAWDDLPEEFRLAVLALVAAAEVTASRSLTEDQRQA